MKLFKSNKIEIRKSPIHRWGVFAKEDIKANELLEECAYLTTYYNGCNQIQRYKYYYPKPLENQTLENWWSSIEFQAIVFGFASLYNDSKEKEKASIDWEYNKENKIFVFKSIKEIKKDEELLLYYLENIFDCDCIGGK